MRVTDLDDLRDRLREALPNLSIEEVELEHADTRAQHRAIALESREPRQRDCMYRMTVAVIDDAVHFFVHLHGASKDLTTIGAQHYSKECAGVDEVLAIVRACWTGGAPS